jgi:energy-converting hydrogenase Eha subunit C
MEPLFSQLLQLGYPAYFGTILGTWKVLGAVALVVPRHPRVKEWAYAGMFIDYTGAVASYVVVGAGTASNLSGPIMSILFLAASWALRPSSRRCLAVHDPEGIRGPRHG